MSKKHISELAEALMDDTAQWMCGISLTEELLAVKDVEIAALNGEIQKLMTGEINPDIHKIEEENKILKAKLNHRNKMLTCSRWIWMLGSALYSFFITVFVGIRSDVFRAEWKEFLLSLWFGFFNLVNTILGFFLYDVSFDSWLTPSFGVMLLFNGCILAVIILCHKCLARLSRKLWQKFIPYYRLCLKNTTTFFVACITMSIEVFFAEWLTDWISMNLIWLWIFIQAICLAIRIYWTSSKKHLRTVRTVKKHYLDRIDKHDTAQLRKNRDKFVDAYIKMHEGDLY